jgi:opacity protein-like surface antigen
LGLFTEGPAMRASKSLIAGVFLLAGGAALAQPMDGPDGSGGPSGVYVGLRGSYAFSGNNLTTYAPTTPMTQLRGSFASGGGGSIYAGTHLPLNLRLEVEGVYRYQPLSKVSLNGVATPASGYTETATPMMNLLWDIPMPLDAPIQPFVGMGVGAAYVETKAHGGGNTYISQSRWDPAYSFITGFAMPLDERSRVTAMYRWMQVRDAQHNCAVSGTVQSACLSNSVNSSAVDLGYEMDL